MVAMTPIPDLAQVSRLDTQLHANIESTLLAGLQKIQVQKISTASSGNSTPDSSVGRARYSGMSFETLTASFSTLPTLRAAKDSSDAAAVKSSRLTIRSHQASRNNR